MVAPDPSVTLVDFVDPIQSAISSIAIDERGVRTSVMMFRENTVATMYVGGQPTELDEINVRATEYTVGEQGPEAMPGPLPQGTGYTYAAEFTVDEAEAAGASKVTFEPPAISYVENFLNFDVGKAVPAGVWDDDANAWIPAEDGLVIEIVGETAGLAEIDITGDGTEEDANALAAVGIDDDEREELFLIYGEGPISLWRVETPHFSKWDYNWGVKPPESAEPPPDSVPQINIPIEDSCIQFGSIIECENQVLGQSIPVAGTGLTLNWRSSRVRGGPSYRLGLEVSDDNPPAGALKFRTWAVVAGRTLSAEYTPGANITHEFVWDGDDAYGRLVQGAAPINICVGYDYPLEYTISTAQSDSKFGYSGNGLTVSASLPNQTSSLTRCFGRIPVGTGGAANSISTPRKLLIGGFDAQQASDALGGWTLSNHHTFSKEASTVYYGDGTHHELGEGIPMIETYAGNNLVSGSWDGVDRLDVQLKWISAIAVAPDGDLYIGYQGRIVKVERDNELVYTVAGDGLTGFTGDGGPATSARIQTPVGIDIGPDGSLYLLDAANRVIRRIWPDGTIDTIAGTKSPNSTYVTNINDLPEDGSLATDLPLGGLSHQDLAVGPEGDVYYITQVGSSHYIRHVTINGVVRHFAGYPRANNWAGNPPDSDPNDGITWSTPGYRFPTPYFIVLGSGQTGRLVADSQGSVWIGQSKMARLDSVANSVSSTTENTSAISIAVTPEGDVVWVNKLTNQIMTVVDDEQVVIAGTGTWNGDEFGNNIPALNTKFETDPSDLVYGPDGSLFVAYEKVVRRIYLSGPGNLLGAQNVEIPSKDGREIHVFDNDGRHLSTRDAMTGVTLWSFGYDQDGRLTSMTDRNNRTTTITRVGGVAQAITSPDLLETTLVVQNNLLESITDEEASAYEFVYVDGYLEQVTDPRNYVHTFDYDDGRLILDTDPASGSKSLDRTELENGFEVELTTELGRVSTYGVERDTNGARLVRTHTRPDGTTTETQSYLDGRSVITAADGTVTTVWTESDPRFGMLAPVTSHVQVAYPVGGLTGDVYGQRFESGGDDWVEQVSRSSNFADPLEYRYDTVTREGTITSPEGRVTTFELDTAGRVIEYTSPGVATVFYEYDQYGRLIEIEQGTGGDLRRMTFDHDGSGFVDLITAILGVGVEREYGMDRDGVGRVLSVLLPDLETIGFDWDEEGRLKALTVPTDLTEPEPHEMTYDPVGMMTEYDPPDVTGGPSPDETTYSYDDDHRPILVTLPNQETIDIDYHQTTHRVEQVTTSEGAALVPTYDSAGRVTHLEGPYWSGDPAAAHVELVYGYNGPLVTSEQWIGDTAGTVSRTFNNRGLVTSQQINGSSTASFTYDEDDLMLTAGSVTLSRSATTGQIETVTLSNTSQSLSYDAFGDVEASTYVHTSGPTDLYEYELDRDQLGRIIEEIKIVDGGTPEVWTYEYDERGRLERVEVDSVLYEEYTYDPNGNRLSVTTSGGTTYATYDEQDRIIDYGDWEYTHGANGEIVGRTDLTDVWAYEYDALGNLILVTLPDDTEIRYEYDGRGRPVARYEDDVFEKGWLWGNQLEPIAEVDDEGEVVARYVYGSRAHVPDYVIKGGVTYRIITDFRGSVVRVVNASTGAPAQEIEYGPWGEVLADSEPGFQAFGYAGGLPDADTGLVLFGARWYDAELGRWMRRDPILFDGGQANLFVYVEGNPVNITDPSGLEVLRCYAPVGGPGWLGGVMSIFPKLLYHQFLKTDEWEFGIGDCAGEAGLGQPACITNNEGRSEAFGATCEVVPNVDEACVNDFMMLEYAWIGRYGWRDNCGDFVDDVLTACGSSSCASVSCVMGNVIRGALANPSPVHDFL